MIKIVTFFETECIRLHVAMWIDYDYRRSTTCMTPWNHRKKR